MLIRLIRYCNHNLFWAIMAPKAGGEPKGALADAIRQALSNPTMREAVAEKGIAHVRDQFSFTRQAETMDRYLSSALAGRNDVESEGSDRET